MMVTILKNQKRNIKLLFIRNNIPAVQLKSEIIMNKNKILCPKEQGPDDLVYPFTSQRF